MILSQIHNEPNCIHGCQLAMQGTYVEGIKEEVVLSSAHALSLIASGEGTLSNLNIISI